MAHEKFQASVPRSVRPDVYAIEPLLAFDPDETFTLGDADLADDPRVVGVVQRLVADGALQTVGSKATDRGDRNWQYQWDADCKATIEEYMAEFDAICPEGHRPHIYHSEDVPEGYLSCKFCAEEGRTPAIPKERVRRKL